MSSNLLLPKNNEKNAEEEEGSNEGGYTPPTLPTGKGPGVAPPQEAERPKTESPKTESPKTEEITRGPNGSVKANAYRAKPNLGEAPIVVAPNNSGNYQELPDGPEPSPSAVAAQEAPAKKSAFQAAFTRRYGNPTSVAPSEGSGDATKKIIAVVVSGTLAAVTAVLYNQFPSYGATIMNGFMNAAMIFGGLMIVITAISIMMNVYKPDGFAITLFAGWLGMIGAWVIVPIYTVYHTFWPIPKRPYFGLFPAGFSLPGWGLIDMILEPFHDGSSVPSYKAMLKTAHQVLYGSSE
jgi:hypothetical protein